MTGFLDPLFQDDCQQHAIHHCEREQEQSYSCENVCMQIAMAHQEIKNNIVIKTRCNHFLNDLRHNIQVGDRFVIT